MSRFCVHVAGDERVEIAERAQDRQSQLVCALVAERRIDAHCRRAVRDLYHLGDIVDVHAVALGERFDLIAVTLARVDIGKVDGIDIHARKERGKAVGVVLVIMRQHHGVERRPCGAQIVRRDRAGVDVGILLPQSTSAAWPSEMSSTLSPCPTSSATTFSPPCS